MDSLPIIPFTYSFIAMTPNLEERLVLGEAN
jgi:hypothetical protein